MFPDEDDGGIATSSLPELPPPGSVGPFQRRVGVCRPCCVARSTSKAHERRGPDDSSWRGNDVARAGRDRAAALPTSSIVAPAATVRTAAPPRTIRLQSGPTMDRSADQSACLSTHSAVAVGGLLPHWKDANGSRPVQVVAYRGPDRAVVGSRFACCGTGTAVAATAQDLSDCHLLFTQVGGHFYPPHSDILPGGKPICPGGPLRGAR